MESPATKPNQWKATDRQKNVQGTLCYLVKHPGRLDILGVDGKVPKYTEQLMNILHHPEAAVLLKLGVLDNDLDIG
jgi:hypothetical protein